VNPAKSRAKQIYFNMDMWASRAHCGTIMCIGGTAEFLMKEEFGDEPEQLYRLFHPDTDIPWPDITPNQAAIALRNYLTHGEPRWDEALAAVE
jgi:hypothetical protein